MNDIAAPSPAAADATTKSRRPRPSFAALRPLLRFLRPEAGVMALALVALVAAAGATLAIPLAVRRVVDFGFSAETRGLVDAYFGMILMVIGVLAVASSLRYYLVMTIGERVVARVRRAVFERVMTLDAAFFDSTRSGEVVSRLTADTTQIKATFGSSASIALRNLMLFLGAALMMVVTSPALSALVLLALPFIVLPLVAAGRGVGRRSRAAQDTLADAAAFATERIGAARTVQGLSAEHASVSAFGRAVDEAYRAARQATLARALLTAVIIFLVFASITGILWVGAQSVIDGGMSAGRLSQFVLYAVFAASSLGQLSEVYGEFSQASGAAERIAELLATTPTVADPEPASPPPAAVSGALSFRGVRFSYPTRSGAAVLGPLDLEIAAGERVAVVGPSGAGKSTLLALAMRFYDPQAGRILIDGVPIHTLGLADLRRLIAFVPQDPVIFATTIRENLLLARPDAEESAIRAAAQKAAAASFIERLPAGYETMIGERGITLSGGERQRLAIARAILRDAPILLLDEATSALDAENERLVQAALETAMAERTSIVVAHRLATIRAADRILVMDNGRIVEEGSHEALLQRDGLYARLARLQFAAA